MGEPSAEEFENWVHPCDVIEHYHQERELNPEALVTQMLIDGKLRAAARQLVLNGRDHGLALIPREAWAWLSKTEVWITARAQLTHVGEKLIRISAYDVRIDPQLQAIPELRRQPKRLSEPASPLPEARLTEWAAMFFAESPSATEADARAALTAMFPRKSVSRERLRRIMPPRRRGRPLKSES